MTAPPACAPITLVCLAPAGAAATTFYQPWARELAPDVVVLPVDVKGRGIRRRDEEPSDFTALVADLAALVRPHTSGAWALFGHSFGGLVAYELARHLIHELGCPAPVRLFVSGRQAPHAPVTTRLRHLDEDAFVDTFVALGGLPERFVRHRGIRRMILPPLLADITLDEMHVPAPLPRLKCPVTVLAGRDDPLVDADSAHEWRHVTDGQTSTHIFAGGHFYLEDHTTVLSLVRSQLGYPAR